MPDCFDQARMVHPLQESAVQDRLQAIRTKLSLALTFCSVAETELDHDEVAQAQKLLQVVREAIELVQSHLDEPNYVPREHKAEIRERLMQVEKQAFAIEARLITVAKSP